MTDLYLKAADADALYAALEAAGIVAQGEGGYHVTDAHSYALDVVGEVHKPTGETVNTEDGLQNVMRSVIGFHVNLRVINADNFDAKMLAHITIDMPNNPVRGWA